MMRPSCTRKELFRTPYLPAELVRKPRDRQALIFRCRTQATRLAPASTTPALAIPMMTPAKTSKGKWTPRYTRERTTRTPASTNAGANGGYITESVRAPAAAVAEWPEGKELEEGVFVSGAISVSHINGRARSKRYLAPSATLQDAETAAQGIRRRRGSRPVSKKARAARKPQRAPAVPATVKARITAVSGAHFRPKSTRNSARSRSLTLRVKPFKFLPRSSIHRWLL